MYRSRSSQMKIDELHVTMAPYDNEWSYWTGTRTSLVIHHAHPASHCLPLPSQLGALEEDLALMLLLNLPLRRCWW